MKRFVLLLLALLFASPAPAQPGPAYFAPAGHADAWSGGVRMIPIHTPAGNFRVWTKRVGNNPRLRVLLLHGGPGATHEYFEAFDSFLPAAGIEYYYYDQLGSRLQRPAATTRRCGRSTASSTRSSRSASRSGSTRSNFCLLGHSLGRHPGHGVRAAPPAAPQGPDHLQHDGERSRPTTPTPRRC